MSANILVATPQPAVGELLRFSLEESSKYRVRLTQSGREALAAAGRIKFDLAILDAMLSDPPLPALASALREFNPEIRLVVIPLENGSGPVMLNEHAPDATLNLPFYAPDLFELMGSLLVQPADNALPASLYPQSPAIPSTLGDPARVSELMNGMLKQSGALQAILVSGHQLWSSAGQLEKKHRQELSEVVNRHWNAHDSSDVAKFVHLTESGGDGLLYATSLTLDSVLAVFYESTAPMTRIRGQVIKLGQALRAYFIEFEASQAPAAPAEKSPPAVLEQVSDFKPEITIETQPSAPAQVTSEDFLDLFSTQAPTGQDAVDLLWALENEGGQPAFKGVDSPGPASLTPDAAPVESEMLNLNNLDSEEPGDASEMSEVSLSDLLAAMPSPDPHEHSLTPDTEWVTEGEEIEAPGDEFLFPWERIIPPPEARPIDTDDTQPIRTRNTAISQTPMDSGLEEAKPAAEAGDGSASEIQPLPDEAQAASAEVPQNPEPTLAETLLPNLDAVQIRNKLEDIEASAAEFASLTYTCVMIPALPDTKLSGPLADRLGEWLAQLCLAYGWRLIDQTIQPETFRWTVQVSQVVSPGNIVRLVRMQISQRILDEFGLAAGFTPAGQFWAPGYLIISGSTPPEDSLIQNFLEQSRKRMGAVN